MQKIVVIGLGSFGMTVASELGEKGKNLEVMAVDHSRGKVEDIKEKVSKAVVADASDREALEELGIQGADVAIVSLGDRVDLSIMVTLFLKELGVGRIYTKAISEDHAKALSLVGATETIFPEKDEALRLAGTLTSPNIVDYIRLTDQHSVVEVVAPQKYYKKSLRDLKIRENFGIYILGIHKPLEGKTTIIPPPDYKIVVDDVLILVGSNDQIEKFKKLA